MAKIESRIDPSSEKYQSNFDHHKGLANDLNGVLAEIRKMGPPKRIEKHKARGKQTARERIENLKDPNNSLWNFPRWLRTRSTTKRYQRQASSPVLLQSIAGSVSL